YTVLTPSSSSVDSSNSVFNGCPAPVGRSAPYTNAVDHAPRVCNTDAPNRSSAPWAWEPPVAATWPNHAATLHCEAGLQLTRAECESRRTGSKLVRTSSGCAPLKADASSRSCLVNAPRVTTPNVVWVKSCL